MLSSLQLALLLFYTTATVWITSGTLAKSKGFSKPPNFPSHIPLRIGTYENWSMELTVRNLWFATPSNAEDVKLLANWAFTHNYTLRACGYMHTWSPMTVTELNKVVKNVVLVDTTKKLTKMQLTPSPYPNTKAVRVGSGATMHNLLSFLEDNGLGMAASPAIGDITIGGVLAIGGHGTSVLAVGEKASPGFSYGSISNLVISLTAVVWDPTTKAYLLRRFKRSEADTKAFLVSLGRTIITEVVLMVGPNYNLRCESRADIPSDELFSDPADVQPNTRTFSRFLDETGRIETILFPFSNTPWLKKWSICAKKPVVSLFARKIVGLVTNRADFLNPVLGPAQSFLSTLGNFLFFSFDIWGPSKNLLLFVQSSTLRQAECGFAVITKRSNVQKVVSLVTAFYKQLLRDYSAMTTYPINGVIEIRATGLDVPYTVVPDGEAPLLSPVHPVKDRPDLDTAVWIAVLSFDNARHQDEAFMEIERFIYDNIEGADAVVRPEWSKAYGYTAENGPWTNSEIVQGFVQSKFDDWNLAVSIFDKYDPHRIFTNDYLDKLVAKV